MNFANPTALRLGLTGTLAGKRYRVAGRVVMGMEDGGETYFWNEFNIINDEGESATLVFEETELGGEWKLFIYIEPADRLTAAEAAKKRVGDRLNIDGTSVRVSLVDESRVYHIEGQAGEGVETGDIAHYFNAEAVNTMIVVSWTGDDVEYFRGVNLPRGTVARAFGINESSSADLTKAASFYGGGTSSLASGLLSLPQKLLPVLVVGFIALVFLLQMPSCNFKWPTRAPKRIAAPTSALKLGDAGKLAGANWHVRSHAVVQISEVGRIHERHEYDLVDDDGNKSVLVHGLSPGADDWFHFNALAPLEPLQSSQAAAMRVGDTVNVDGVIVPIRHICQTIIRQSEFASDSQRTYTNGDVWFGFSGESSSTTLIVRWDSTRISFLKGNKLNGKEIREAFRLALD